MHVSQIKQILPEDTKPKKLTRCYLLLCCLEHEAAGPASGFSLTNTSLPLMQISSNDRWLVRFSKEISLWLKTTYRIAKDWHHVIAL